MERVNNITELNAHLAKGHRNFLIALMGGGLVSRKHITPAGHRRFDLFNGIDGTTMYDQTGRALLRGTNIGVAMKRGAFYCED